MRERTRPAQAVHKAERPIRTPGGKWQPRASLASRRWRVPRPPGITPRAEGPTPTGALSAWRRELAAPVSGRRFTRPDSGGRDGAGAAAAHSGALGRAACRAEAVRSRRGTLLWRIPPRRLPDRAELISHWHAPGHPQSWRLTGDRVSRETAWLQCEDGWRTDDHLFLALRRTRGVGG
ncbi:hypothetical protein GCM10009608_30890 [Pseudonocardia alaniniphila]